MAQRMVQCVKLGRQLPGIDAETIEGEIALDMVESVGSKELRQRVYENVSMEAWKMWLEVLKMIINEYRLNVMDEESNEIIRAQMEQFFFGEGAQLPPGYVPPRTKG
jgi:Fe-S cluster biosynthesis and repair protein YggX